MSIRVKIILVVLPLIIVTLVLAGSSSFFVATTGITRIAKDFLGFKASELEKYAENQWALLVEHDFTDRPEMVAATKGAVETYARSVIRSDTELIIAVDSDINLVLRTGDVEPKADEVAYLKELATARRTELVTFRLGGVERVGKGFYFDPFGWYLLLSEEKATFYRDVDSITLQTGVILAASSVAAVIMLLVFASLLTRPLQRLGGAMGGIIASGELSSRVPVEFNDETGRLSQTFNVMIQELERAYGTVKRYAYEAVLAQKKEQRIRQIFEKYVPQDVIDQVLGATESMLVGENRVLSILFSDIRSFTSISEKMMPDELVNSLNKYFTVMVDIIMNRRGTIDKYIGDAIMAFWGTPVKHDDDGLQSVLAALEMIEALEGFNSSQTATGKPPFNIGVGINYGIVTVGNIGSERKMNYTVIGDMVNLTSRLEGLTKTYHQEILISQSLQMKVRDHLPTRHLDSVAVKGKSQGAKIYTVKRELSPVEQEAWGIHDEAMDLYYKRGFQAAADRFKRVATLLPGDFCAELLMNRCLEYSADPPPRDWSGVEVMKTK